MTDKQNNNKKRILHLIDSGGMYGAESVIINLSREMKLAEKYEPVIGCIVQNKDCKVELAAVARKHNIEAHHSVLNNYLLLRDIPRFIGTIKKLKIDLIHSHGYKASVFAFIAKLLIADLQVTATCHLWFEGAQKRPLKMRIMLALEKLVYRFFPLVIGVSEDIRSILIKKGVSKEKLRVVENGIFMADYQKISINERQDIADSLGLQKDDICIVNVARLTEQKAQSVIIQAAGRLQKTNTKAKFFIIGEGKLRQDLQQMIERENLQDAVFLLGFREDIPKILQTADIFILPSLDEGMPMALLEAIASNVPVITTAVGDIPKIIVDRKSGIIIEKNAPDELATAIREITDKKIETEDLTKDAWRKMQKNYSSNTMYSRYDEIYTELLSNHGPIVKN